MPERSRLPETEAHARDASGEAHEQAGIMTGVVRVRPIVVVGKLERTPGGTTWKRLVDAATGEPPIPGDVFYHPGALLDPERRKLLSVEFWESYRKRERYPIVLVVPDGTWWAIDHQAYSRERGYHGRGWSVTRVPPLATITVRPSIRTARYHGIVTNGQLVACADSQT
jgi:hypothetical protein